jgi:pilus assembly protein CpaB
MTYRVKNIGIAVILAAFAGLLTIFYVTQYKRHVQHGESKVSVLVAARDIPAGTSGAEVVGQHYLSTETVPRRTVVPGAVSSSDQLNNLVVTQQIFKGEQVTTRAFGTAQELGIRAQLRGTERAIQLAGDANQLLAGTLQAGDHVDIVGAWSTGGAGSKGTEVTRVILRNLLVLSAPVPPKGGGFGSAPNQGGLSVQLRLTDAQSLKLKWINEYGDGLKFHLELRPPVNSADSPNLYQSDRSMMSDRPGNRGPR